MTPLYKTRRVFHLQILFGLMMAEPEHLGYAKIGLKGFNVVGLLGKGAYSVVMEGEEEKDSEEFDQRIVDQFEDYMVHQVAGDGNCLFHAIEHQLQLQNIRNDDGEVYDHELLRVLTVSRVDEDSRLRLFFSDDDCFDLARLTGYVDHAAIAALAEALGVTIIVHRPGHDQVVLNQQNEEMPSNITLRVLYNGVNHYDSLMPMSTATETKAIGKKRKASGNQTRKRRKYKKPNVAIKIFKQEDEDMCNVCTKKFIKAV